MMEDKAEVDIDIEAEPPAKRSKVEELPKDALSISPDQKNNNKTLSEPLSEDKQENGISENEPSQKQSEDSTKCVQDPADGKKEEEDVPKKNASAPSSPTVDKSPSTELSKPKPTSPTKTKQKKKKKKKVRPLSKSEDAKALQLAQAQAQRKAANLRKNIKDILKTESLGEETLAAQREEAERRERQNLKLQQLKAQAAAAAASSIPTTAPSVTATTIPTLPPCDSLPDSAINPTTQIYPEVCDDIAIDSNSNSRLDLPPDGMLSGVGISLDEIVLSSDDDDQPSSSSSRSRSHAFHQSQQQQLSELRMHLSHQSVGFQQFSSIPAITDFSNNCNHLQDQNIISISSGDEDDDTKLCDKEVTNSTAAAAANGNGYSSSYFKCDITRTEKSVRVDGNNSDDDCVVVSPTPENDDVDKDERNLDELNILDAEGRVLINVGHPDEDPDIFLAPQVSRIVKPHQIGGIRFLYDNVVESVDRFSTASGFGCILAHSMGLGKTLQAVSFCDVFLRASNATTVLIIVPINTIQNWLHEFNVWLPANKSSTKRRKRSAKKNTTTTSTTTSPPKSSPNSPSNLNSTLSDSISETVSLNLSFDSTLNLLETSEVPENKEKEKQIESDAEDETAGEVHARSFQVFVLNETVKTLQAREKIICDWKTKGGVMLIGYEMYRMLALKKLKKSSKKQNPSFFGAGDERSNEATSLSNIYTYLVDPGPDLVICDEGHRIKNSGASISQALKAIRTRRRVVLTGYPLQNNLMEYWCMVDFIRPNYLGSKVEFSNMFERPISNGQCVDSTPEDRKLMRFRSHVLHSLLEGFVQRRSHAVLHSALPQKQEWVFLLKMTTVQYNLYKEFMQYLSDNTDGQCGANPIKAFAVCCKIWNHPDALYNVVKRKQNLLDDLDLDELNNGSNSSDWNKPRGRGKKKKEREGSPQISFFDGSGFDFRRTALGYSSPMSSTSRSGSEALSLDWALPIFENYVPGLLENGVKMEILFEIIKETVSVNDKLLVFSQTLLSLDLVEYFLHQKFNWTKNAQYYRLDGSTTGLEREKLINNFNNVDGVFVFLVSTRAGSLGINLTGANRVVVLDASWNPCHDCQAVCRIYRYGQTKPCQIYRFVSDCTLEKRIYDRQINKRGMSDRVVDEMNPNAQFKSKDVSSFLVLNHDHLDKLQYIKCDINPEKYSDPTLQNVLVRHGDKFTQEPFEHESLLIDQKSQRLSATEKRLAHRNYLSEKRTAELQSASGYSYSRPSYAAYYPKDSSTASTLSSSTNSLRNPLLNSCTSSFTPPSNFRSLPVPNEDKFEYHVPALRAKGICVQSIVLKKDSFLADPSGGPDMYLMGGEKVYVLRSEKGTYLRISNGKLIAVRNNASNSRFPILTVPSNQDLSKEQLQTLVYSFLKLPGHHSYNEYSSYSAPPTEQPVPPSASFFSQNKHHLQVTNARSNSGGDVTMWQPLQNTIISQPSNLVRSPLSKHNSDFSKPQTLSALLDSSNGGGGGTSFSTNLEKLSYLARFSSISTQHKEESRRNRGTNSNDDNSNSSSGFSALLFPQQCQTQMFPRTTPPSVSSDVEVLPISKKRNNSNRGSPSMSSSSATTSQTAFPYGHTISTNRVDVERHAKSNDAAPSFYEDFTITVKSPKPKNNCVSSFSANNGSDSFVPHPSPHFNFDRGEYFANHDQQPNVSSSSTNPFDGSNNGVHNNNDFANFNQYYNNGLVQHNNSNISNGSSSSSSKNEFPFHPNQGV